MANVSLKDTEYRVTLNNIDKKIKAAWTKGYLADVNELLEERYVVAQNRYLENALVGGKS